MLWMHIRERTSRRTQATQKDLLARSWLTQEQIATSPASFQHRPAEPCQECLLRNEFDFPYLHLSPGRRNARPSQVAIPRYSVTNRPSHSCRPLSAEKA